MIVTHDNFQRVLDELVHYPVLSLDTETTGLRPYHGHRLFSIILSYREDAFYFNWNDYPDFDHRQRLTKSHLLLMSDLLGDPNRLWFMHNARYDLAMLAQEGLKVMGRVHDTMAIARVLDSTLWQGDFSLDACAARLGFRKSDVVKSYILSQKLYTVVKVAGKKTQRKDLHYSLVPWDLILPYGEKDAQITYALGLQQQKEVLEISAGTEAGKAPLSQVYTNEIDLIKTVFEMERLGVKIDADFCKKAISSAEECLKVETENFFSATGEPFKDSALVFKKVFAAEEERWVYGATTATGKTNPSFDSDALKTFTHPAAQSVVKWRKAKSDVNYFHGFLYEADRDGVIHASFNQHIAATGRFSSSNPNLQNLTKPDDEELGDEFLVRRAIVPRPGMVFHMLDYDQMEYRLMLDYAATMAVEEDGVRALIKKVLGGLDVHQATADVAGIDRRSAKTVNFATLYGSGIKNLSERLGVSEPRARDIRDSIFRAAPEIRWFITRATSAAEKRGFVVNWYGRRCLFPDASYAYRAPNYLIQGGCADVVKLAMNRAAEFLGPYKTRLVLMIHDELVLEGPPEEAAVVIPAVKRILEAAYPYRHVPLTCGVDHSFKSLADKAEGIAGT